MALPKAQEARSFYQSALQRFLDAQFLMSGNRTTAAVYLAGYAVECMLKALLLAVVPQKARIETMATFRGSKAHDFVWLKRQYIASGGAAFPPHIARCFSRVNNWTTDMRYKPGTIRKGEAEAFLAASEAILNWADGRL